MYYLAAEDEDEMKGWIKILGEKVSAIKTELQHSYTNRSN